MKCMVHGRGLVAWVTAAQLAAAGHEVMLASCAEPDDEVRQEPGLEKLSAQLQASGALQVVTSWQQVPVAELPAVHFIALTSGNREAVFERANALAACVAADLTLVVANTVPVGTLEALAQSLSAQAHRVTVLAMPLFIRSGQALADFAAPALLLIGEGRPGQARVLMDWLRPYSRNAADILVVPLAAAELAKFAVNAMLASRISVMNELANVSERLGVDVELVRQAVAADPRIGSAYLQPGCGFGGPSFTEELFAFADTLREAGGQPGVLDAVLRLNAEQRERPFRQLWRHFGGQLEGKRVTVWGVAYKPGAASVDDSPALPVIQALLAQGVTVVAHDPKALSALKTVFASAFANGQLRGAEDPMAAAEQADALVLLTAWPCYHNPDFTALKQALRSAVIFDGRNVYEPSIMAELGFAYYGIGRGLS